MMNKYEQAVYDCAVQLVKDKVKAKGDPKRPVPFRRGHLTHAERALYDAVTASVQNADSDYKVPFG